MEKDMRFIEVNSDGLKIKIEGEGAIFGSLDLQVNAIKALISVIDFKFAEEADEYAMDKVYLQLLDAIGASIRFHFPNTEKESKNIEFVFDYLKWILEQKINEKPDIHFLLDIKEDDETDGLFDSFIKEKDVQRK